MCVCDIRFARTRRWSDVWVRALREKGDGGTSRTRPFGSSGPDYPWTTSAPAVLLRDDAPADIEADTEEPVT